MIYKIVRLFVDALIADDKQYLLNRDNLTEPIQMQLSQKQNTFSQFTLSILKSILNLKYFPKKKNPHSWFISEIKGSKKGHQITV